MNEKIYYIYIMTNPSHTVLYVGMTNNIVRRVWEHKQHVVEGFTKKYNCSELIFYESCGEVLDALEREKQLKKWSRKKKEELIFATNPDWNDLSDDF